MTLNDLEGLIELSVIST